MSEAVESLTRNSAIKLINDSIDNFTVFYEGYCNNNWQHLTDEEREFYEQMHDVISILRSNDDYRSDLKIMPLEDLKAFLMMCRDMVENNNLSSQSYFPKGDCEIIEEEENQKEVVSEIENSVSETFDNEIKVKEILYFLNNYKSLSNWEYSGHGSFIAKKNATLWELGGIYWCKLFELPENSNLVHIGDEIKLKKEVIDAIYEYSVSDVTGNYSFESKSPDTLELIYGIISFCAGNSNKVPKLIKYGFTGKDLKDTAEILVGTEETATKLSYFIQNYATEGQEEDVWKKFNSLVGLFGSVFSFFGLLASTSIEENKYQIVQYNQRKAFINSAQDEIKRLEELKSSINEKTLQSEIEYLRFLEEQIKMLQREIELNDKQDNLQINEIKYITSQHACSKDWKDSRYEKSPEYYHNIDYHKIFEEQK